MRSRKTFTAFVLGLPRRDQNDKQHPFAKPESGKALIYFLQDDPNFLSRPRPTTRFGLDGNWIGATQSNSYFIFP